MKRSTRAGASLALHRLGTGRLAAGFGVALFAVVATALWERSSQPTLAADRTLTGVAFGLALPLFAYFVLGEVTAHRRLDEAVLEVARRGADRRLAVLGLVGSGALLLGVLGALLAAAAILGARGPGDPALGQDLAASAWVGALGGVSYAWLLAFGSCLGRRGGGRLAGLLADWFLGAGTGAFASVWPRGHLRNLLGAEPVLGMPQTTALLALAGLVAVYAALALWRSPR